MSNLLPEPAPLSAAETLAVKFTALCDRERADITVVMGALEILVASAMKALNG